LYLSFIKNHTIFNLFISTLLMLCLFYKVPICSIFIVFRQSQLSYGKLKSIKFLMHKTIIVGSINYNFLALSFFASCWWFPRCINPSLPICHVLHPIRMKQMTRILIIQRRMICFKNICSMISVVWVDKIVLSWWIIVLIM